MMENIEENKEDSEKQFKILLSLVKEDKIFISWRVNSFKVIFKNNLDKDDIKIINNKEFNSFTMKLMKAVRKKILENSENNEYDKYIDEFIEVVPYIKSDILTRSRSNLNICNNIEYEILTKRYKNLDISCFSALINLEMQKPGVEDDKYEQINFELSERDIKTFIDVLNHIQNDIEKLKH